MAAEAKQRGNDYFGKRKYSAAADQYTEAIAIDGSTSVYWSNRAVCRFRLGDFDAAESDCRKALELERTNTKALYFLGRCLCERKEWEEGEAKLAAAVDMSKREGKPKAFQDDVRRALRDARKAHWAEDAHRRDAELDAARDLAAGLLQSVGNEAASRIVDAALAAAKARDGGAREIPDHLCCRISREIFFDPVVTPHGHSFERSCIEAHLRNSSTCPLTRMPLRHDELVPNLALKEACDVVVDEHPWAWRE